MSELAEIIANIFYYWPVRQYKDLKDKRSLRGISFRKVPNIMQNTEKGKDTTTPSEPKK